MAKIIVSEKQIVSIHEFMENYLGKQYDWNEKLTHDVMSEYLIEQDYHSLKRVSFDKVKKDQILTGECVVVKDETGKIIIYKNPRSSLESIYYELHTKANIEKTKQNREKILKELKKAKKKIKSANKAISNAESRLEREDKQKQLVVK